MATTYPGQAYPGQYAETVAVAGHVANLALTEADDALSAQVAISVSANAAITEAGDALSALARVSIGAATQLLEAADTLSALARISTTASAGLSEAPDALSSTASAEGGAAVASPGGGKRRKPPRQEWPATIPLLVSEVRARCQIQEEDDLVDALVRVSRSSARRRREEVLEVMTA